MRGHDGTHPRVDRLPKRLELDRVHPRPIVPDHGQRHMRVGLGVTVPRKVLAGGDASVLLDPTHERDPHPSDVVRVLAERPDVDDGVVRIVVHVEHGGERQVDSERARLDGGDPPHLVGQLLASRRPDRHEGWEVGGTAEIDRSGHMDRAPHSEARPRLEVRGHQQRELRVSLQIVELGGHLEGRPHGHDDTAHLLVLDHAEDPLVALRALRSEVAEHPRHDELSGLLLERELRQRLLGPARRRRARDAEGRFGRRVLHAG